MKKIYLFFAAFLMVFGLSLTAFADVPYYTILDYYTDEDIQKTAEELFEKLDPGSDDTKEIYDAYKAGQYSDALAMFRNYTIDRLRAINVNSNYVWQKTGYTWEYAYRSVDIIAGRYTVEELNKTYEARSDLMKFTDGEGAAKYMDTNQPSHFDWKASMKCQESNLRSLTNINYGWSVTMAARYAMTGDVVYLKKLMQLLEDWSDNYYEQIDEYYGLTDIPLDERTKSEYFTYTSWDVLRIFEHTHTSNDGPYVLGGGGKMSSGFVLPLILTAKTMGKAPEECDFMTWWNVLDEPVKRELTPEEYDLIDPVRLGKYINEVYYVFDVLTKTGQHQLNNNGIAKNALASFYRGFAMMYAFFKDFKVDNELKEKIINHANNFFATNYWPDGGLFENAFSYATSDIDMNLAMPAIYESLDEGFHKKTGFYNLTEAVERWKRLEKGLKSNAGELPNLGNYMSVGGPALWKDEKLKEEYAEKIEEQEYTSIYFPYGGYAAMRSGWDIDDSSLSLSNSTRRTEGHYFAGTNAVLNFSAFGRTMIISGGFPWYRYSDIAGYTEFLADGYAEINGYMYESSSRKYSTVMVNDKSQASAEFQFNKDGSYKIGQIPEYGLARTGYGEGDLDILSNKWFTNDKFDFSEGSYKNGYVAGNNNAINDPPEYKLVLPNVKGEPTKDAEHTRRFFNIKEADVYIVLDELVNTYVENKSNKYSQIWNFAGYEEGSQRLTGYTNDQVVIDDAAHIVKTQDKEGPNLFIMNFSPEEFEYKKYYGYYKKGELAYGWTYGGTDRRWGKYAPRADVHVIWHDEKKTDVTQMASVLAASENCDNPVIYSEDLSDKKNSIISFVLKMKNGVTVEFNSSPERKLFSADDTQFVAKTAIFVKNKDGVYTDALLVDCTAAICGGLTKNFKVSGCCAVQFDETGDILNSERFITPDTFVWVEDDGAYVPEYNLKNVK